VHSGVRDSCGHEDAIDLEPPAGGGGTYDGMEPRVARLESDVAHIRDDVAYIKNSTRSLAASFNQSAIDFARLDANVGHLPSKGFIVTSVTVGVGAIVAILTFLSKLGVMAPTH